MIGQEKIKKLATKFQTTEINIVREYLQHLFLSFFYKEKGSKNYLFKGGTALRIVYDSPRFSEDLDFSGVKDGKILEKIIEKTLFDIERFQIETEVVESKKTSGGWFNTFSFAVQGYSTTISCQVSFRKKEVKEEVFIINNEFVLPYKIILLNPKELVEEKITALTTRAKARDLFDLYFILRTPQLRRFIGKKQRKEVLAFLKKKKDFQLIKQLKIFLPVSYHPVLKDLKEKIILELEE